MCREHNRGHCDGGCEVESRLDIMVIKIGIGAKVDEKRLDLEERVHDD